MWVNKNIGKVSANLRLLRFKNNKPDNYHHPVPYAPQSHTTAICLKMSGLIWHVEYKYF